MRLEQRAHSAKPHCVEVRAQALSPREAHGRHDVRIAGDHGYRVNHIR